MCVLRILFSKTPFSMLKHLSSCRVVEWSGGEWRRGEWRRGEWSSGVEESGGEWSGGEQSSLGSFILHANRVTL